MKKQELIEKVVQNENSAFTELDESSLSAMPEDFLKRLYLSLVPPSRQSAPVKDTALQTDAVQNTVAQNAVPTKEDLEISKLKRALLEVQAKLNALRHEEKDVIKTLSSYGITVKSVFNESVTNITEADIEVFVHNSKNPIAQIIREALDTRNQQRQVMVEAIVMNSGGLYTAEELMTKTSEELDKLSQLSARRMPDPEMTNPPLNWQGAGIADMSVTNLGVDYGSPLALPTTWDEK
ncbi:MAG: hypothetical protein LBU34_08860 [Planctomycetaceae bacterium]|jgi:hypothetical protein|nr:hypothetical protein [Planctomycetaceae bacterium]